MGDSSSVKDRGPFVHTWTGSKFYFTDPRPEDVFIEDIAHALSLQCRFNGHIAELYSVAEHSVMVADIVEEETKDVQLILTALLHDAAETYLGDVVSPLKGLLHDYRVFEKSVEACIATRFSLAYPFPEIIGWADKVALAREFKFLSPFVKEPDYPFCPLPSKSAEKEFLVRYSMLTADLRGVLDDKGK
jgi:hypothetical protein